MSERPGDERLAASVWSAMKDYRCTYTVDDEGDGLSLDDMFSHDGISEGWRELEMIHDAIMAEVVDCIRADQDEITRLRAERDRLRGLLGAARCPNDGCDGNGYPVPLGEHYVTHEMAIDAGDPSMEGQSMGVEWGQEQCQWCHERRAALAETTEE